MAVMHYLIRLSTSKRSFLTHLLQVTDETYEVIKDNSMKYRNVN